MLLTILTAGLLAMSSSGPSRAQAVSASRTLLDRYCLTCHTQKSKERGIVPIALDGIDVSNISADPEVWEKVIRKMRAGLMPPPGSPRPDPEAADKMVSSLEAQLDHAAEIRPDPGRPLVHRLNRTEYANAIRDLLELDIDAASLLPPDDSAYGFDNVADALGFSPLLQERYLSAAMKIAALAVGDPRIGPAGETYRIRQDVSQDQHIEGMPLGTIGGARVGHNFPLDGEYVFQARLYRTNLNMVRGLESPHEVEFTVDGQRVHTAVI